MFIKKCNRFIIKWINFFIFAFFIMFAVSLIFSFVLPVGEKDKFDGSDNFSLYVCGELLGQYDENLFWRLKNVYPDFPPKGLRVICLTDSVSVMYNGLGYPNILQKYLQESIPNANPVVFNAGVPGYTSFQGLKYFKEELLKYSPDVVCFCFGWNDHWQAGNKVPDKLQVAHKSLIVKLLMKNNVLRLLMKRRLAKMQSNYSCVGPSEYYRVSIDDYKKNLLELVFLAKKNKIELILLTAPYLKNGKEEWINIHEKYNDVVRSVSRQESLRLVDLVDDFKQNPELFLDPKADKCHYNWVGSDLVARALYEVIVNEIILKI